MSQETTVIKRAFFSDLILSKSTSQRIAYIAVMAAFSIVTNMFLEFKLFDVQFSVTIVVSALCGILIGPLCGFVACFVGDFLGFVYNSWGYMYMPWVGLSTAMLALIAGLIFNLVRFKFKGAVYIKLLLVCLCSFFVCTIAINSTGFYLYNKHLGFSQKVIEFVDAKFGTGVTYWGYVLYRLLGGQIWNCLVNYALLFALIPMLNAIKPLKLDIR